LDLTAVSYFPAQKSGPKLFVLSGGIQDLVFERREVA
jgi:hypothetical protein